MSAQVSERAAPDWYADPGGRHEFRYWDGERWTDGVADHGTVTEEPLGPPHDPGRAFGDGPPTFPARAAWFALLGVVAGLVFSVVGVLIALIVARHVKAVALALNFVGLWTGLAGACWLASRRYGTGHLRQDFGITAKKTDIWRGLAGSLIARLAAIVPLAILYALGHRFVGSNLTGEKSLDTAALATYAVIAVVGAPLIEETFFRGLLLQSLKARWGTRVAVGVQALLFGLCHAAPQYGFRNFSIVLGTAIGGLVFGIMAVRFRRLGPDMWAHAWFNVVAVIVLASS